MKQWFEDNEVDIYVIIVIIFYTYMKIYMLSMVLGSSS